MVKLYSNGKDVIQLWREAFGDSEEDIRFFLENTQHAQLVAHYEGDELAAMLLAVDCQLNDRRAKYIYAACTAKRFRGKGYMTQLLELCKKDFAIVCLIPADDALAEYYRRRGFADEAEIEKLTFDETKEIQEYLLDGYHLTDPKVQYYNGVKDNGIFVFG